jgi:ferredoxin
MPVKLKIQIDQTTCVGAGQCVLAAPAVFDQRDEDGIVVLLTDTADESQSAAVRKAAKLCPARSITVIEGA